MMRVLIAGILGGIAMYVWASAAHLSPLGQAGVKSLPNEAVELAALKLDLGNAPRAVYVLPAPSSMTAQGKGAPAAGALGMLAYSPNATLAMTPRQLGVEFALEMVESLLLAGVAALVAGGFRARFGAALLVGAIAAITTNLSYWNWYGFASDYTLANGFMELMKYVVAGVVIALVLGRRRAAAAP
jgi:hypothetical protein